MGSEGTAPMPSAEDDLYYTGYITEGIDEQGYVQTTNNVLSLVDTPSQVTLENTGTTVGITNPYQHFTLGDPTATPRVDPRNPVEDYCQNENPGAPGCP